MKNPIVFLILSTGLLCASAFGQAKKPVIVTARTEFHAFSVPTPGDVVLLPGTMIYVIGETKDDYIYPAPTTYYRRNLGLPKTNARPLTDQELAALAAQQQAEAARQQAEQARLAAAAAEKARADALEAERGRLFVQEQLRRSQEKRLQVDRDWQQMQMNAARNQAESDMSKARHEAQQMQSQLDQQRRELDRLKQEQMDMQNRSKFR